MGLIESVGVGPVALDTVVFVYWIEGHPEFARRIEALFARIDEGKLTAVTSAITLLETLVVPYRAGRLDLADAYEEILTSSRGLRCIDIDRAVLREAAMLRTATRVRTPDAIQLATALHEGCTSLVTNDRDLPALPRLRIVQLSDLH